MTKAREISPTQGSLTIIAGPPGLGKSWICGTMAEYLSPDEVLVIATLPRETNSVMYQKHNVDTIVVTDDAWDPDNGELSATGYDQLIDVLRSLRQDTKYKGIILDNGTEAGELAWHASMEPLGVGDPNQLKGGNKFAPYTSVREKMEQLMRSLSVLTGKTGLVEQPKLVAIPWHVQPPKESVGDDDSADEKGKGAEYEGSYLPMARGSIRRKIAALVDNFVYASIETVRKKGSMKGEDRYMLQVISDRERHVKLAGEQPDDSQLVKDKFIDVHGAQDAWRKFMEILEVDDG